MANADFTVDDAESLAARLNELFGNIYEIAGDTHMTIDSDGIHRLLNCIQGLATLGETVSSNLLSIYAKEEASHA